MISSAGVWHGQFNIGQQLRYSCVRLNVRITSAAGNGAAATVGDASKDASS
jgi:hypothetical protein